MFNSDLQMELKAALVDLGHKSALIYCSNRQNCSAAIGLINIDKQLKPKYCEGLKVKVDKFLLGHAHSHRS